MNLMELLGKRFSLTDHELVAVEAEVREIIARELEAKVLPGVYGSTKDLGIVMSDPYTPPNSQDYFRGAANVVRGKSPATEEDWWKQAEAMRLASLEKDLSNVGRIRAQRADLQAADEAYDMEGDGQEDIEGEHATWCKGDHRGQCRMMDQKIEHTDWCQVAFCQGECLKMRRPDGP